MKKDISNKRWLENHNRHLFRLKVRHSLIVKRKRKRLLGLNEDARRMLRLMDRFKSYTKVFAPQNFSLIENPIETLKFISRLEDCFKTKTKVFVRLRNVNHIGDGALVVLLSSMIKFRSNNIDFNGVYPKNANANKKLRDSGFFDELYEKRNFTVKDTYDISTRSIFTHASKLVDSKLSSNLIAQVSKKIWHEERRCLGVQRAFIELMQNTNNHASTTQRGEHHWWTTVSYDYERQVACFAFLDYGVGIIKSITTDPRSKLHKVVNLFKNVFLHKSDAELLELLLKGEVHKAWRAHSSTHKYFRGKGLPGIYDACKNNHLSNLVVITNKAMAEVAKDRYLHLNGNFSGTFVYWEVKQNNTNLPLCS